MAGSEPVLSCTLSGGNKAVDVCLTGEMLTYAFGKVGKVPDLKLRRHIMESNFTPWNGIGRSIYEEVSFRNQDVTYTVWFAIDRMTPDNPVSGGIEVSQTGAHLASLVCDDTTAIAGYGPLFDRMSELGQCWNYDARLWAACS